MKRIFLLLMLGFSLCSCVKEEQEESASDAYDRVLKAWLNAHDYTDLKTTESGIIYLEKIDGTGDVINDSSFVFLNYYCTDLDGNIKSSNSKELDKQLGTYSQSTYYGPKRYRMGAGVISDAIQEAILGLKCGTECTIIIPSTLASTTSDLGTSISATSENLIYHLEIVNVLEYITEYEENELAAYRDEFFPGLDTLSIGYYFIKTNELPDQDTLTNETSINVRYIGRMLDGTVFDTNIADSAKFYRIYNSSSSYSALELTYYINLSDMIDNNSTVSGFSRAVYELKKGEAATTFFWSVVGYQDSGSDNIPGYSPLRFDIWVEE